MLRGDHSQVAPDAIRQGLLRPSTAEERECRSLVISVVILKVDFGDRLTGYFHAYCRDPTRANPEASLLSSLLSLRSLPLIQKVSIRMRCKPEPKLAELLQRHALFQ